MPAWAARGALGVLTTLQTQGRTDFTALKQILDTTDGALVAPLCRARRCERRLRRCCEGTVLVKNNFAGLARSIPTSESEPHCEESEAAS